MFAQEQGGGGCQAERCHLQDAHQIGEWHARERGQEK